VGGSAYPALKPPHSAEGASDQLEAVVSSDTAFDSSSMELSRLAEVK